MHHRNPSRKAESRRSSNASSFPKPLQLDTIRAMSDLDPRSPCYAIRQNESKDNRGQSEYKSRDDCGLGKLTLAPQTKLPVVSKALIMQLGRLTTLQRAANPGLCDPRPVRTIDYLRRRVLRPPPKLPHQPCSRI